MRILATVAVIIFSTALIMSAAAFIAAEEAKAVTAATKVALSLGDKAAAIRAPGGIALDLEYPRIVPKTGDKLIAPSDITSVDAGRVTLKYPNGAEGEVRLENGRDLVISFRNIPADVKGFRMEMEIPFAFAAGGRFKVGGGEAKEFPAEKPKGPMLFQGSAERLELMHPLGGGAAIIVPKWSYQQLQDNREWNWKTFWWFFQSDFPPGVAGPQYRVTITEPGAAAASAAPSARKTVDRFGQNALADWPDKVKSVDELKADAEAEKAYYASLKPPALDKYGGLPGSGEKLGLKKTGFFHVEKKGAKWFLVDPEGNSFFHLGVCGMQPMQDYTLVAGREVIYEWLPPWEGETRTAWHPTQPHVVSFFLANRIIKYGRPHDFEEFSRQAIERVRAWGFNSGGAFGTASEKARNAADFAYVASLPLGRWEGLPPMPGVTGAFDVFDEKNRARVDANFAAKVAPHADDPLLIGYFLENEPLLEDLPRAIPALKGDRACKRRLVESLKEKYKTIDAFNAAWGLKAASFDELADAGLPVKTQAASDDVKAFASLFLETCFQLVTETFRKYDRNHMLIGNRLQAGTINSESLCRMEGKYLDIISFNYYTYYLDQDFLRRIFAWTGGRPMILSEFYWDSPKDSGLPGGVKDVASQDERGLAYRHYVEHAAAMDFIVGVEWYTYIDMAATGPWFWGLNADNANDGLLAVTDRPWKAMLAHMMRTNYDIYKVATGERQPFVFDDPRFTQSGAGKKTAKIPRAPGPMKIDGRADDWPGVPAETIGAKRVVEGTDAGGVEAAFKLCWDDEFLYVLVSVTDSTPMKNTHSGAGIWAGDGVELFVGPEDLDASGPLKFTDRQVLVRGSVIDGKTDCYFANAPEQHLCQVAVVPPAHPDGGKGYTIEAAIPFKALGFRPAEGKEIRFDLAVDDSADGSRRLRQLMWSGTSRNSTDRSAWGRAALVK